jgi:phosphoribosyl-AMP cyclohydrolase
MPTIKLEPSDWATILPKIELEYGKAATYISWVMKRQLGFQVRNHTVWNKGKSGYLNSKLEIHLDFDDESLATFFRIKYL